MTQIQFQNSLTSLHSKLYYFALSLTSDSDKARDLVQETYLKALTYRDKFSADTNLMAWVYTIMKNTFINEYRRNVKAKTTLESSSHKLQISFSKDDYSPAADSIHAEKEIYKKIDLLENEFREPFQLFLSGFKYKEIAEKLDLPLGTVKSRIFFTRKKLGKWLSEYIN
ncbi:MAG TPA: RNA polymerase sigma factor [Prolixibacteraceae bacterium]|jgi:RNA polymerase sigma-70 factor (ECF subfamily)